MSAPPRASAESDTGRPDIIGLRPTITGAYVSLRCGSCAREFECYQPTIGGLAFGAHVCPECSATCDVLPEDFEAALARHLPDRSLQEMVELTEEATRLSETWYRADRVHRALSYRGVALAPPTERALLSVITLGLVRLREVR